MSLRERFSDEIKTAMKAGDKPRVSTIRLIQAALKDKDIENRGAGKDPLGDDEILGLLGKMLKQRGESIAIFEQNGRADLAAGERTEAEIITGFMPRQLDAAETDAAIGAAIAAVGAASMKDMGKVVAHLRAHHAGQLDFAKASGLVKARLAG